MNGCEAEQTGLDPRKPGTRIE